MPFDVSQESQSTFRVKISPKQNNFFFANIFKKFFKNKFISLPTLVQPVEMTSVCGTKSTMEVYMQRISKFFVECGCKKEFFIKCSTLH